MSPWDQLAWDLGQDLGAEPSTAPRVFKSHLRCMDALRYLRRVVEVLHFFDCMRLQTEVSDLLPKHRFHGASYDDFSS